MSLQIVLIIVGLIVIASIYLSTRFSEKKSSRYSSHENPSNHLESQSKDSTKDRLDFAEGILDNSQLDLPIAIEEKQLRLFETNREESPSFENEINTEITEADAEDFEQEDHKLIKIYVRPKENHCFEGPDVLRALNHVGMNYGSMEIFHKTIDVDDREPKILFSAANMFEPGIFNLQTIEAERCGGLVFFMETPTLMDDGLALETFLDAVEQVAKTLGGILYKAPGEYLDKDYLDALRLKLNFIVEND